jgi:hypothetical protein
MLLAHDSAAPTLVSYNWDELFMTFGHNDG